jgi:superfamily I DNA/RNA helicase
MILRENACIKQLCNDINFLLVDEMQDSSRIRRGWVTKIVQTIKQMDKEVRVLVVGDPCQAIFHFAGAECDGMQAFQRQFCAKEFSLSTTFRCPRIHVDLADGIIDEMNAMRRERGERDYESMVCPDDAIDGIIENGVDLRSLFVLKSDGNVGTVNTEVCYDDAVILCRNNAPLLALRGSLMSKGVRINMLGRKDLGQTLHALYKDLKPSSIADLLNKLRIHCREQGR